VHAGDGSPGGAASARNSASLSPQARARADAAAILAAFVPPPGASRLGTAPAAAGGVLRQPVFSEPGPDHVDDAGWWRVPGQSPQQVLGWEKAHLPRQFTASGSGIAGGNGVQVTEGWWSLPAVAGVLPQRELTVSAIDDGNGSGTDLRLDANVEWLPARPAWSILPVASIKAVVVTAVPGGNDSKKPPAPVTVTDPARVRKLVDLVNVQPMASRDVINCPSDDGRGVQLTFLAGTRGPTVATEFAKSNGCGGVQLTLKGQRTMLGGGNSVAQQALAISGMNWKLFGYLPT